MWFDEVAARLAYEPPTPRPRSRWLDSLATAAIRLCGATVLVATTVVLLFLARAGLRGIHQVGFWTLLAGLTWKPERGLYGGFPLVFGTAVTAGGAMILGATPAILAAIWVSEFSGPRTRTLCRRAMEIAAAMPSVVYGWLALTHLVPVLRDLAHHFDANTSSSGEGVLASAMLLAVMIAPTVFLLSFEAITRVPDDYRNASLVLGASPWQTVTRVIMPACWRGILIAVFFGLSRAAGETMAVQMVIGGARLLPTGPFSATTTIASQVVMDMQNARPGTTEHDVLFSMALVLLAMSASIVLLTRLLASRSDG